MSEERASEPEARDLIERLVSPNEFDGFGTVPDKVNAASHRVAQLRVQWVTQYDPDLDLPLNADQIEAIFDASVIVAEWSRELYAAREQLAFDLGAARGELAKPQLGLATTRELLNELETRIEMDYYAGGGGLGYTTVHGRPESSLSD